MQEESKKVLTIKELNKMMEKINSDVWGINKTIADDFGITKLLLEAGGKLAKIGKYEFIAVNKLLAIKVNSMIISFENRLYDTVKHYTETRDTVFNK